MTRTPPIFDGTADTFDCGACGEKHPRILPDDDGVHPDARGGAWRLELLIVGAVLVALAILAGTTIAARIDQHRTEASK